MSVIDAKNCTAYRGHIISPLDYETYIEYVDGVILVSNAGKIEAVGPWQEFQSQSTSFQRVLDYGKRLILPGFIDLHVHLVQIAQTGRSGDTLLGWLNKYIFPAEAKFASADHAVKLADWFFRELSKNGTTLASVFTSIHHEATDIAFQSAAQSGCRVIMGKVLMDRNAPPELTEDTAKSLELSEELCRKWHGYDNGRLSYAFTPRFAPTSTSAQMRQLSTLWQKYPGSFMQTHLSENTDEINWVRELFPDCQSYLDVYDRHGLVGPNSLFAHSIHLSDQDLRRLGEAGAATIHCPSSNFFLKSGAFPYKRAREAGVHIGLGSDIAAGPEISLFKVMKDASYIQTDLWLNPRELLYLSTLGGAKAINMDKQIGSLEVGKEADFIVIDPTLKSAVPFDILDQPVDDILSGLIYVGDDRMIVATYVRGRPVYQVEEVHERQRVKL